MCYEEIEEGGGLHQICHTESDPISRVARNATTGEVNVTEAATVMVQPEPNITIMILIIIAVALVFSATAGITISRC